jgi:hypothetical protein
MRYPFGDTTVSVEEAAISWAAVAKVGEPPLARTKAVVAICVVFVPSVAVGAVGTPDRAGESSVA